MEEKKCIQIFVRIYEENHNTFEDLEVDVRLTINWISQSVIFRYVLNYCFRIGTSGGIF